MKSAAAIAVLVILGSVAGIALGGGGGGIVAAAVSSGLAVIAARLIMPRERPRSSAIPSAPVDDFPRYRELSSMLPWSQSSNHYFNVVLRPVLVDAVSTALQQRRGIDLRTQPEAAATAIGADLWTLVDPTAGPDADVEVSVQRVAVLLGRTERL